ncbi:MAG: sphingosine kinase [Pseudomonadota bacterium]|nr:sphingosine kinase [Pseudomonadota bacterium]
MRSPGDIVVIVNGASGRGHGSGTVEAIEAAFRGAGQTASVACVDFDAIGQAIDRAIKDGARLIVIGGGDGTLSAAASALVDTDATLGVLPLGTLNHFAKDQQIPLDLAGAVRAVVAGRMKRVDVGEVNGAVFLNNSSLGIYPDIVRLRRRLGFGKWMGLIAASWMVLRQASTLSITLATATGERRYNTPFAFIGNNEYVVEGFEVGERKTMQAGQLCLYTSRLTGRVGVLRLAFRSLFSDLRANHDFDTVIAPNFVIQTPHHQLRVAIDGEVSTEAMPLHYRSRAGALRVMVPRAITNVEGG